MFFKSYNLFSISNSWFTSDWRPCSQTCGKGTQTRVINCRQKIGPGKYQTLDDSKCSGTKPSGALVQVCNKLDCPSEWITSKWSGVSLTSYIIKCCMVNVKSWMSRSFYKNCLTNIKKAKFSYLICCSSVLWQWDYGRLHVWKTVYKMLWYVGSDKDLSATELINTNWIKWMADTLHEN